jgi:aspartate aminotransferase
MDTRLSDRINNMATSATLAMAAKARELKEAGKDIIGLSLGEPDFTVPDFVKEAAIQAVEDNYHAYTPVDGYGDLKAAIIKKFERDNQLVYEPAQIVVSTGAKQSLANLAQVLLNEGDEVILPAPYWVSYSDISKVAGGVPVVVPTSIESDFKITPAQLEAAITPKTKMIIYSSPCNPSGSVYSKEELRALADVLVKHPKIIVISDEIYEHINFTSGHASMAAFDDMYDRTVTVNGVSKAFAMTGWRIGYIGAPAWIARACNKMQGQVTSGANCIAQRATIAALEASPDRIQYMIDAFHNRRELILGLLAEIPGFKCNVPEGAFYVFPDVSYYFGKTLGETTINSASDMAIYLLEHAGVATVTGEAFGDPNCIRISYAASEDDIRKAMKRIKEALS